VVRLKGYYQAIKANSALLCIGVTLSTMRLLYCRLALRLYLQVPAALSLLPLYDWLWVVDSDTLVMTPEAPLTQYIDNDFEMVVTQDCNGINTGWAMRVKTRNRCGRLDGGGL
jgi:hypothetical protein